MAWHYTQYDKSKAFTDAEQEAKSQRLGLWADKDPVAPWEFRKQAHEQQGLQEVF